MARYVVAVIGAAIGFVLGGPTGAMMGFSIGSTIGTLLFPPKGPSIEGPRLTDLQVQTASYGQPIPWVWGHSRLSGNVIWCTDLIEVKNVEEQSGGKGAPSSEVTTYEYFWNGSVGVCRGEAEIIQIWGDSKLLYSLYNGVGISTDPNTRDELFDALYPDLFDQSEETVATLGKFAGYIETFTGSEEEIPSPLMESFEGSGNVPAYKGLTRADFGTNMPVADFGNRVPNFSFEVFGRAKGKPYGIRYYDTLWTSKLRELLKSYDDPTRFDNLPAGEYFGYDAAVFHGSYGWVRDKKSFVTVGWQGFYDDVPRKAGETGLTFYAGPTVDPGSMVELGTTLYTSGMTWFDEMSNHRLAYKNVYTGQVTTYPFQPVTARPSPVSPFKSPTGGTVYLLYEGLDIYGVMENPFRPGHVWHGQYSYYRDTAFYCTRFSTPYNIDNWTPHSLELGPHANNSNSIDIPLGFTDKWVWALRYGGILGWDQIVLYHPDALDQPSDRNNGAILVYYTFGNGHYDWNATRCFAESGEMWEVASVFPDDGTNYPIGSTFRLWRYKPPSSVTFNLGQFTGTAPPGSFTSSIFSNGAGVTDVTPWLNHDQPGGPTGPESIPSINVEQTVGGGNFGADFGGDGGTGPTIMAMHGTNHLLLMVQARSDYNAAFSALDENNHRSAYFTYIDISNPAAPVVTEQLNGPGGKGYFRWFDADLNPTYDWAQTVWVWRTSANNWANLIDRDYEKSNKVWDNRGPEYLRWISIPLYSKTGVAVNGSLEQTVILQVKFVVGEEPVVVQSVKSTEMFANIQGTGAWQTTNPLTVAGELRSSSGASGMHWEPKSKTFNFIGTSRNDGDLYKVFFDPEDPSPNYALEDRFYNLSNSYNPPLVQIGLGDANTAEVTLAEIVRDICVACDMVEGIDFDVTALESQIVRGYTVPRGMTGRAMIEPLQAAFAFDGIETDGKLVFKFKGGAPVVTVPEKDLGVAPPGGEARPKLLENRVQEIELPSRVFVRYSDRLLDFQMGAQQARRSSGTQNANQTNEVELAITMKPSEARATAERILYQAWVERNSYEFQLPPKYIVYDPGDVLAVEYNGALFSIALTEMNFGGDGVLECKGIASDETVYLPSNSGSGTDGASPIVDIEVPKKASPMVYHIIDGPLLREADDLTPGFYVAAEGTDQTAEWVGGAFYKSSNDTDFALAASFSSAAVIGESEGALPSHEFCLLDRTNTLRVNIGGGVLNSCSFEDLMNGFNVAMLGDEMIAFMNATLVSAGIYDLTVLRRGVNGTEWACGTHVDGDRFILLSGATGLSSINLTSTSEIGLLRYYRGVATSQGIADVTSVEHSSPSNRWKPMSPVHITGTRAGDDLTIAWYPRSRLDGDWRDGVETVVDEPTEAYEIDIMDGVTVKRTLTSSTPNVVYTAAQQTTDFGSPQASVAVKVYMISSRVGRGYPGSATV